MLPLYTPLFVKQKNEPRPWILLERRADTQSRGQQHRLMPGGRIGEIQLHEQTGLPSSLFHRSVNTGPMALHAPHQSAWNFTAMIFGWEPVSAALTLWTGAPAKTSRPNNVNIPDFNVFMFSFLVLGAWHSQPSSTSRTIGPMI